MKGTWSQEQRLAYWLVSRDFHSLLSYRAMGHLLRDDTDHWLGPPTFMNQEMIVALRQSLIRKNASQTCPEANLMEVAIPSSESSFPGMSRFLSSW